MGVRSFKNLNATGGNCGRRSRPGSLPGVVKLTNTDPFAAWFLITGDATPDGIRVVRSLLGAISSLPIVAFPG